MRTVHHATIIVLLASAARLLAVGTSHWTQTTEADFKAGTFHNVVATNLGDLKLSRAVKTLLGQNARVSAVHAMVEAPDGTIYAGTGPEGLLLAIKNQKASEAANVGDNVSVFSLLIDSKGGVLIGTGGEKGQIFRIEKPGTKPVEIFSQAGVQYVWAIYQSSDGTIYAATGPNGQLFAIAPDGKAEVIFKSDENNLLSMTSDGNDLLYVGTEPNGLVYRVNRKTRESFVLYDAPEDEISALVLDKFGNLYAATAESGDQNADALLAPGGHAAATEKVGRTDDTTGGVPIPPNKPPENPNPPTPTPPAPGKPAPIPKEPPQKPENSHAVHLLTSGFADPADPSLPGDEPDRINPAAPTTQRSPGGARGFIGANAANPAGRSNAIYKIDPDGFVTELFRQPVLVYALIEQNGLLIAGTGSDGYVYQINPTSEETVVIAKVDPKEVIALLPARDGSIYLGLANSGEIGVMSSGVAADGTYTSPVLDATQVSRFGKLQLHGTLPERTSLTIATRSSNVNETTDAGWSKWSDEVAASQFVPVTAPAARFLQYRLTFKSDGKATPVVDDIDVAYQMPNLAPNIKSVKIAVGKSESVLPEPVGTDTKTKLPDHHLQTITWEAADPNSDALRYTLYFRSDRNGPWIMLKDKLTEQTFDWDTRAVGDGRYEIKVVASDAGANPRGQGKTAMRVSDPVIVDNTAPVIGDIKSQATGNEARIDLRAVDRTSTIASLEYAVDSHDDWQAVLPVDKIADAPEEMYSFSVPGLSAGAHQIAVRVADAYGNQAYANVNITIPAPTAAK